MTFKPELIIGLVGAAGTNFNDVANEIASNLDKAGYSTEHIRLSSFLGATDDHFELETKRIEKLIKKGNNIVSKNSLEDSCTYKYGFLAANAVKKISQIRKDNSEKNLAFIINSLKRPDEVHLLRNVYGRNFVLISIYEENKKRIQNVLNKNLQAMQEKKREINESKVENFENEIKDIQNKDKKQEEFGQNVLDTYHKAHYFLKIDSSISKNIQRFVEILLGSPYITPTIDEYGMYIANAASLRSSDPKRQVGAAIVNKRGSIISTGVNEVPKYGGGVYWEGDVPDYRDFVKLLSEKSTNKMYYSKRKIKELTSNVKKDAKKTEGDAINQLESLLEYYRSVHAEECAICEAALRGVSTKNKILYVTTFPCHLCAKKVIASGIKRVIYIEPYPKSKAEEMYEDMIVDKPGDTNSSCDNKVIFDSFTGVSPTRYRQVFHIDRKHKRINEDDDTVVFWDIKKSTPPFLRNRGPINYLLREYKILKYFSLLDKKEGNGEVTYTDWLSEFNMNDYINNN